MAKISRLRVTALCGVLCLAGCMTGRDGQAAIDWDSLNAGIETAERLAEVYVKITAMLRELEELQGLDAEAEATEAAIERADQMATLKDTIEMLMDTAERLRAMRDTTSEPSPDP